MNLGLYNKENDNLTLFFKFGGVGWVHGAQEDSMRGLRQGQATTRTQDNLFVHSKWIPTAGRAPIRADGSGAGWGPTQVPVHERRVRESMPYKNRN